MPMPILEKYANRRRIYLDDIQKATTDDLLALKRFVDDEINEISGNLKLARAKVYTEGKYANPEWFARSDHIRKRLGGTSQAIQIEFSRRRRENVEKIRTQAEINRQQKEADKEKTEQSFLGRLLKAMDLVLTPGQKQEIVDIAKSLLDS